MNKTTALSKQQKDLIVTHIKLVDWVIYEHIHVNETASGLSYDDLYQEGCLALCHAAATYNGSTQFKTYAQVVVRNHLLDYCRGVSRSPKSISLDASIDEENHNAFIDLISVNTHPTEQLSELKETIRVLESAKPRYSGVALKGIEAIELKIKGYSGKEIAELYGVKSTHVGAWISRAAQKLRQDKMFLLELNVQ